MQIGNLLSVLRSAADRSVRDGLCLVCKSEVRVRIGQAATGSSGLIYSDAGLREWKMSGACESCFDTFGDDE